MSQLKLRILLIKSRPILLMVLACLTFSGCNKVAKPPQPVGVGFVKIAQGVNSDIEIQRFEIVRSQDAYQALWQAHAGTSGLSAPALDFQSQMLIAGFAGNKPSGGYGLAIEKISQTDSGLEIELVLIEPGSNCLLSQALSQPYLFATTPVSNSAVNFTLIKKSVDCQ